MRKIGTCVVLVSTFPMCFVRFVRAPPRKIFVRGAYACFHAASSTRWQPMRRENSIILDS